jgi:Fanconi anemia group M protein
MLETFGDLRSPPDERLLRPRRHRIPVYVEHPFIRPERVEARAYQVNIAQACLARSSLVVLPTGMGKTIIALLVIADMLQQDRGRVLFMAPTKPLVEQHAAFIRNMTTVEDVAVFTGEVPPEDRELDWREHTVVVSTPQVIANDLRYGRYDLDEVGLIVYDEAHRAVGNYAYVHVAARQEPMRTISLGMTASPGTTGEEILQVCDTLHIENVEIRSPKDVDVAPYMHEITVKRVFVEVPPYMTPVITDLRRLMADDVKRLSSLGLIRLSDRITTKELLAAQRKIQAQLGAQAKPPPQLYGAASAVARAMKVAHALELAETQGAKVLSSYLDRVEDEAAGEGSSRAARGLVKDTVYKRMAARVRQVTTDHPKADKVEEIVREQFSGKRDSRVIVFTHYRDNSELIAERLSAIEGIHPVRFVGQATRGEDKGLTQKEQVGLIEDFKKGTYNVLVATSVAEEGLDIPSTDLVVFYEPIPSEIRTIQRRGRTGRARAGEVRILVTRGTRDEAYTYSAKSKEEKMYRELERLRKRLSGRIMVGEARIPPDFLDEDAVARDLGLGETTQQPSLFSFGGTPREAEATESESPPPVQEEEPPVVAPPEPPKATQAEVEEAGVVHVAKRESEGWLAEHLKEKGVRTRAGPDGVADYRLSKWVGVRRLRVDEFHQLLDRNELFQLAAGLKENFPKPVIVVEGRPLAAESRGDPKRVWAAITALQSDWEVAVINTKDAQQTSEVLLALLLREAAMESQGAR